MSSLPDGSVAPSDLAAPPGDGAPLPTFEDRAPPDRFCDLVLTGGVTSSIAYPALLLTLAGSFRFHSIGGSSSGAGAAALAAAAEYRRRHGSTAGFHRLLERMAEVREWVDEGRGITRLRTLFQPLQRSRRLFEALVPALTQPEPGLGTLAKSLWQAYVTRRGGVAACVVAAAVLVALAVLLVLRGPAWGAALAGLAGLAAAIAGLVAAGAALWRDFKQLSCDDFGLCSGTAERGAPAGALPPLTDWLHGLIQEIAGRRPDEAPLTFADLRDAPASPRALGQGAQEMDAVSIRLQVYAANITLGRPLVLPLREEDDPVYFVPRELRRLFPDAVVDAMKQRRARHALPPQARAALHRPTDAPAPPGRADEDELWELPRKRLPILVAARMSVSAPLLFAPVPVWMLDRREATALPRRCLLSDGGLCSNFPIHMFDCAVPSWPTFGVALRDAPKVPGEPLVAPRRLAPEDVRRAVSLPTGHRERPADEWNRFGEEPSVWRRTLGFAAALAWTAKDWNDALLAQMPGVRDRIVRIELPPGIGGLNIGMTPDQIQGLSDLGLEAGRQLLARFAPPGRPDGTAAGWAEHRWMRLHLLRHGLAEWLAGARAAAAGSRYGPPAGAQIAAATERTPLDGDAGQQLDAAQAALLQGALDAVLQAEAALTGPAEALPCQPWPQPVLCLRPPL